MLGLGELDSRMKKETGDSYSTVWLGGVPFPFLFRSNGECERPNPPKPSPCSHLGLKFHSDSDSGHEPNTWGDMVILIPIPVANQTCPWW